MSIKRFIATILVALLVAQLIVVTTSASIIYFSYVNAQRRLYEQDTFRIFQAIQSELIANIMLGHAELTAALVRDVEAKDKLSIRIHYGEPSPSAGEGDRWEFRSSYPLTFNGQTYGYVDFFRDVANPLDEYTVPIGAYIAAQVVFAALVAAAVFHLNRNLIFRPLRRLLDDLGRRQAPGSCFSGRLRIREVEQLARAVQQQVSDIKRLQQTSAIARVTQMVAHDIRRPFTKLRSGMTMLEHVEDVEEMHRVSRQIAHEIEGDLASVNHMLEDILVAGNDIALQRIVIDLRTLVLSTLIDACTAHPNKDVALDLGAFVNHKVFGDAGKLSRVVANILDDALQAMPNGARLWIRTQLIGDSVEVAIGNTGSVITADDMVRLFEPFFTKGKRRGTGLGLSIAQRIVEAHGGTIACASSAERGTEFVFTIAAAVSDTVVSDAGVSDAGEAEAPAAAPQVPLPQSSAEARATLAPVAREAIGTGAVSRFERRCEAAAEATARRAATDLGRPLRVLVVDDEDLYIEAVATRIATGRRLAGVVEVHGAQTAETALALALGWAPDLVVCDIDLSDPSGDGFDLVARLRGAGFRGRICVHSNRSDTRTYEEALAAGADAFLPKPLSHVHLLGLLTARRDEGATRDARCVPLATVAVVDDDVFMLEAWRSALAADAAPITFANPEEFWRAVEATPGLLDRLSCLVTDYYFDNGAAEDGITFAAAVRRRAPRLPILLSTNAQVPRSGERAVDWVIGKVPMSWRRLVAAASGAAPRRGAEAAPGARAAAWTPG